LYYGEARQILSGAHPEIFKEEILIKEADRSGKFYYFSKFNCCYWFEPA